MPVQFRPLQSASEEYDMDEENLFRRAVENYLFELASAANDAASLGGAQASLSSKRENFLSPTMTTLISV
tara:strand:- start:2779 stop:2988 length:210 start_codon:yes stop_codon:yes gene_type:complete